MSKHLFAFLLTELNIVRIICQNPSCKKIVEMSFDELARKPIIKCPLCTSTEFNPAGHTHTDYGPLFDLAKAVVSLKSLHESFDLEFVLPVDPTLPPTAGTDSASKKK